MEEIKITVPKKAVSTKLIVSPKGDFTLYGVRIGDKFMRFSFPKGHELPDGEIVGHLYARPFESKFGGKFTEIAIWVDNSTEISE